IDFPPPYFRVGKNEALRWTCTHTNGIGGDPAHPPKRCDAGCEACGWTGGRCSTNGPLCAPRAAPRPPPPPGEGDDKDFSSPGHTGRDIRGPRTTENPKLGPGDGDCPAPGPCNRRRRDFCCPDTCAASPDANICWFTRGVEVGAEKTPRTFTEGQPMPLVFG